MELYRPFRTFAFDLRPDRVTPYHMICRPFQDFFTRTAAWKAVPLVTEAHTRRRRGCPRIEISPSPFQPGRLYLMGFHTRPFAMYCLPGRRRIMGFNPRTSIATLCMYGVTHSIALQAIHDYRNLSPSSELISNGK